MARTPAERAELYRKRRARERANKRALVETVGHKEALRLDALARAIAETLAKAIPITGDNPAEQHECLRERALARSAEFLSIPLADIHPLAFPVLAPHLATVASKALTNAIRIDEGQFKARSLDAIGELLERARQLRDAKRALEADAPGDASGGGP